MPALSRFFNPRRRYRVLEMIPGALSWATLIGAVVLAFWAPFVALFLVLILDVYRFIRITYITVFIVAAYRRYRRDTARDWSADRQNLPQTRDLWHLVMVPTVREPEVVLRATFDALLAAAYDPSHVVVVFATEASSPLQSTDLYDRLSTEYGQKLGGWYLTKHPAGVPGEITGKGANTAYAAKHVQLLIANRGIPADRIIVTTIDADSVIHPQYLQALAVTYARHPRPTRSSYQPIPLFHNNIWDALPWMRVVAYSTTFWLMSDAQRPDRLFTFSSHSMSWQALVDVGFWQSDVVSEDSRIFIQCLIHYDGDYEVTPMFVPISMDAIQAPTWWESMKNQYKQIRRWGYGAENFPFMVWNFAQNQAMSWSKKIRYLFYQLEGSYVWAAAPLTIMILSWLPLRVLAQRGTSSVLAQNAPLALRWLMLASFVGAGSSVLLCLLMLPRNRERARWYHWLMMAAQWALVPVTMVVFGSIPALEAQTRLMIGKYLGFWVTDKHRQPSTSPSHSVGN